MYAYDIQTPAFLGASGLGAKSLSGLPPHAERPGRRSPMVPQ